MANDKERPLSGIGISAVVSTLLCLGSWSCVSTYQMPKELTDNFLQYPIQGRMEPVESPILEISVYRVRDIRSGLVSMSHPPGQDSVASCQLDYEYTFVHGLENSWITTCQMAAQIHRGRIREQTLQCNFKPLAGKSWALSMAGGKQNMAGQIQSRDFTNQVQLAGGDPAGVLISSQGLNIGAVSLNRPGFLRITKGLGREEIHSMAAVSLSLALFSDRFHPLESCFD